ncbi:hypothetical protein LCGC14_3126140, partial [marine sediment metagenome]
GRSMDVGEFTQQQSRLAGAPQELEKRTKVTANALKGLVA